MKLLETRDGSYTFYREDIQETYHSVYGALGESMHVYIQNGLYSMPADAEEITVLEVGFGTGLNALLTAEYRNRKQRLNYFTLEPFPITSDDLKTYYREFRQMPPSLNLLEEMLDSSQVHCRELQSGFYFKNMKKKLEDISERDLDTGNSRIRKADLVYYDAFAPGKQPEMWAESSIDAVIDLMAPNARLVTYCAQGQFKRTLRSRGMRIETPRGAFGKREMTVAIKERDH